MRMRAMRRVTARATWDRLRVSFWFAPAIMSILAILLAWAMFWLDGSVPNEKFATSRFVLAGDVDELRSMLVTIATTVLTTAGVVFTLLTLPLSTVAAQYGSRLLRVFLGDRTTQLVLGMFAGTFVYCITAALSIPPIEVEPEAPQLTATVGMFLMIATFATLILLIQHISTMLQAPNIAAAAGEELLGVIRVDNPDEVGGDKKQGKPDKRPAISLVEADGHPIHAKDVGYIQTIDPEMMLALAHENDLVIRLLRKPGAFVVRGEVVALVWPASKIDEWFERQFQRAYRIGNQRTPTQDVECAVNQLVEMAVRAMSPAINDPFTAMTCLDHIGNGLALFVQQGEENLNSYDRHGRLRLIFEPVTFGVLLEAAFNMLRHASADNAAVLLHIVTILEAVGREAKTPEARRLVVQHIQLIQAESRVGNLIDEDRQRIRLHAEALGMKLGE